MEVSKEETMDVSSDRRRPQVSDFEDADTLRLVYQQHQFIDAGHYNCIISNKVCARSLGARPLSGNLSARMCSFFLCLEYMIVSWFPPVSVCKHLCVLIEKSIAAILRGVPRCHTDSPATHPVSGRSCASAPTEICFSPLLLSTECLSVCMCLCSTVEQMCVWVCERVIVCEWERQRHENEKESDNTDVASRCTLREY